MAMRKLQTAVKVVESIVGEAGKNGDPFGEEIAAAMSAINDIAKRTTWLAEQAAKKGAAAKAVDRGGRSEDALAPGEPPTAASIGEAGKIAI